MVAVIALVVAGVLIANRAAVASWALPRALSLATGTQTTIAASRFRAGSIVLSGVRVRKGSDPLFDAQRVEIDYSLRDLLPGSAHRFGLHAVALDRPVITLVRHADGSYSIPLSGYSSAAPSGAQRPNGVPFAFTVRVRDGSIALRAPHALDPLARSIDIDGVRADASINSATLTHYRVTGAFAGPHPQPFTFAGSIDQTRGYAMQRATAAAIPLRPLANFFINSNAARVLGGNATGLDLRVYALGLDPNAPPEYHVGGNIAITGASMRVVGLGQPIESIDAKLQFVDDQLFFNSLRASIAQIPLIVSGSIFNFSAPQFRLGIAAQGNLSRLRSLFAFAREQPIAGDSRIRVVVEGPVDSPAVLAAVDSPNASYRGITLDHLHAVVAYRNSEVMFLPLDAQAQGADIAVRGALTVGNPLHTQVVLHVTAPADALPYAGELLGKEPLAGDVMLDGRDTNFAGYGALQSARSVSRMAALIHMDRGGVLDVAPLWINTERGQFAAAYSLDRTRDTSAFWIRAQHLSLRTPQHTSFLGASLPVMPPIDGTLDDASIAGGGPSGNHELLAGTIDARDTTIGGVQLDRVGAQFAGTIRSAAIDPVAASGPWGSLVGKGVLSLSGGLAVRGIYHGTLQGLRQFMNGIPASGYVDGPAALAISSQHITVQAEGLRLRGANVHGIPISQATGTLAVVGGTLHVYNARVQVAGGTIVAAGEYNRELSLVATHLSGAGLHGLGLPLSGGTVDADGQLSAGLPLPTFRGGVAVANGRVQQFTIAGSALVAMGGNGAQLDHVVGGVDGLSALAAGYLGSLNSGNTTYQLHATVPAADLGAAIATIGVPSAHSEGTFDAALDVRGAGLYPNVRGPIGVPAGSVNGLPFVDATGLITADRSGAIVRQGGVTVASTHLTFAAAENPRISGIHVRTSQADLSDFNNFFDTGDTLDGNGSMRFDVISQGHRISSNGQIDIAHLRYRNLPIGSTVATWSSLHNVLRGSLDVDGAQGSLRSHGSISFAGEHQVLNILRDSRYDIDAQLSDVDLSTWIAALGYPQVAITGRVDGNASVNGRFPRLNLKGTADLKEGTVWRLPIDQANLAFSSSSNRILLDSLTLSAPGLSARASGSFGLSMTDPLALSLYASSNNLPELVAQLWRVQLPVSGEFESTLDVKGTLANPTFEAAFDASNAKLYGIEVPLLFGSMELRGRNLVLSDAGVEFKKGTVAIEGSLPIVLDPFGIGPSKAPLSLDLAFNQVDPSAFDVVLGNNTKLGGEIDGELGLSGTVETPRVSGKFAIAKGSYVSDLDLTPITGLTASLTFNRTTATVDTLKARLGNGSVTGSGFITFPNGFASAAAGGAGGAAYSVKVAAHAAQLNLPQYGAGAIDANLVLARTPGQTAKLSGTAALTNTTIPFSAFIAATQSSSSSAGFLPALNFDVNMAAGKNVRVRGAGFGAGLDIGAAGAVHLTGSLADPSLDGSFKATGGTLTYFDRAFRVQHAVVTFDPSAGIIPTLHATGTTHVTNPDPNTAVNPYGSADITVSVNGPINGLKIDFSSNPPGYTKDQILAMIAPFGGLINGLSYAPGANEPTLNGTAPNNNLSPVPGAQPVGGQAGTLTAGQEAFNVLNAQFSAGLLSPLEGALSESLGLQNVNLTLDYYGNVGISASRFLGKTVNLVYATTFGIPQRTSFGLQFLGERATSAQLSFFWQNGPLQLFETPVANESSGNRLSVGLPLQGQSGFAFTLQRLFW